ncbi:MAG: YceD family protein [Chlamydiia bacterium]
MANIPPPFRLYVDRLQSSGHAGSREELISESVPPDFLDVHEKELQFPSPVSFSGKAYMAGDQVILKLAIETEAIVPCPVCNEGTTVVVKLGNVLVTMDSKSVEGGILDLRDVLREEILLATPQWAECRPEGCPERATLDRLRKPS